MSALCDSWRPTDRKQSIPASVPCVKFQSFSFNKTYNHSCNAYNRSVAHQVRFEHNWYRLKKCTCPYDTHRLQMKCQQTLFDRWQLVNVIYKIDNIPRYRGQISLRSGCNTIGVCYEMAVTARNWWATEVVSLYEKMSINDKWQARRATCMIFSYLC